MIIGSGSFLLFYLLAVATALAIAAALAVALLLLLLLALLLALAVALAVALTAAGTSYLHCSGCCYWSSAHVSNLPRDFNSSWRGESKPNNTAYIPDKFHSLTTIPGSPRSGICDRSLLPWLWLT